MTLETRKQKSGNRSSILTECPLCGKAFGEQSGESRRQHYLQKHDPEDFGL